MQDDLGFFLQALSFSAHKHRKQKRKGADTLPYINHPIDVAALLRATGDVRNVDILVAAILHDTLEDTDAKPEEISSLFGTRVLALVREVTDDKNLPHNARKARQIEMARQISHGAKLIKLADKICNVRDISIAPPKDWSRQQRIDYVDWTEAVVDRLRGTNATLEQYFDQMLDKARRNLSSASPDPDL